MKKLLLKSAVKAFLYLLWVAPNISTQIACVLFRNKSLKKFKSRPMMLRRASKAFLKSGMIISQLNVTNVCNQNCPMCNLKHDKRTMPIDNVRLSIDRLAELGSFMLTLTGGEPFLHPDIAEIVNYAFEKDFFINVNTNASVPLELYQSVDMNKIYATIISFHATDESKLEKITGIKNTLPRIKEVLKYLKEETATRIILKYVIQRDNLGEIEKVHEFAEREGFTVEYHPIMVDSEDRPVTTKNRELLLPDDLYIDTLYKIKELKKSGRNFESSIYYQFCIDAVKNKSLKWDCDAGINYSSISPGGQFGICKDVFTSAKITDDDFIEKYRSIGFKNEMKELRERCNGCNWSCYVTASKMASTIKDPNPKDVAILTSI